MVVKLSVQLQQIQSQFESRAVLDGSQTGPGEAGGLRVFESRAVLDGSQTLSHLERRRHGFESRAVLAGSQTLSPMLLHRSAFESRAVLVVVTDPILTPTQIKKNNAYRFCR